MMSAKRQKLGHPLPPRGVEPTETGSAGSLAALNATHGTDGVIFVEDPKGPSAKAILTSGGSKVELFLFGAHVTSWQASGVERTWMSRLSKLDGSAPIRGGVPIGESLA
jgi:hypothetical protein